MAHYYLSVSPRDYDIQGTIFRCRAGQVLTLTDAEHAAVQHEAFPYKRDLEFKGSDTVVEKEKKDEEDEPKPSVHPVDQSTTPDPAVAPPSVPPTDQSITDPPKDPENHKVTAKAKSQGKQH
jgi:hypothetical protein